MFRYVLSLVILVVFTAVLAPPDTGIWLNWALKIELAIYSVFLTMQMVVFRGKVRAWALAYGPTLCFVVSVVLVILWTIAAEYGALPHPH